ncbi:MAG: isochorismatase family protein [Rhizobiaceae bacterium]
MSGNEQQAVVTDEELKSALDVVFRANSQLYAARGFQRRVGFGMRPALLLIDLANAWTRPGHAFSCSNMEEIIPANQALLNVFRARGLPVIYTTTAYQSTEGPHADSGVWGAKIPLSELSVDSEWVKIDDRVAPEPGEQVIVKKNASAFTGTNLANYLTSCRVDTLIITGVTASACVRHSVEDAISSGFRPIIVREGVGDRIAGAVEWNLFDIDAKFGDVEPLERVLEYLRSNEIG